MDILLANILGSQVAISIDDPVTMLLSAQELRMAHDIKRAVEADAELTNLTDFEYVQYALTHPTINDGNIPISQILQFVAKMQAFREEYDIHESVEEGEACVAELSLLLPGLFLGIHYLPSSGNCISINDWAAFYPAAIKTREQYASYFRGSYYRFQCMNPTFLAIREGMSSLFECDGVKSQNFDFRLFEQTYAELYQSYPKRYKEVFFVNSPSVVNMAYGLWKRYMSKNMKETFHLGFQINGLEGYRIDSLFKTPTEEQGRLLMIKRVKELLTVRYYHRNTYRLPPLDTLNG
jgi:CRAL/TRIO domain